LKERNWTCP